MRILFLTPFLPHFPLIGPTFRPFYWLRRLGREHEVHLVSFIESPEEEARIVDVSPYCASVRTVLRRYRSGVRRRVVNLFESSPYYLITHFQSTEMQRLVTQAARDARFDLVHATSISMGQYVVDLEIPVKVLDAVDCDTRNSLQRWTSRGPLGNRFRAFVDWCKLRNFEPAMLARFDKAVLASAADRDFLLQSWGPLPLSVVANGVDLDYFRPQPAAQDSPSLVFVGDLTYFPNEDAVLYFCSKILPLITKRCRPVRFYVVGRGGANRLFKAASQPNVVFAGFVSDIRPIVAEASVVVCPLRIGTGIKMKVLLAMAMGKATVSSSVGVEGIAVRQGEHVVVADTPGEFSAAILRLLEDAGLRRSLGLSARALVEREHDWGRLAERWNELYGECEACRSGSQKARRQP